MTRRPVLPALIEDPAPLLFLWAALVLAWPIVSWDLWWHLAAGREILQELAVPRAEAWSHTLRGTAWIDFEWLAQVPMRLLERLGGFQALVWAKAALGAAACGVVYRTARAEGLPRESALLAWACALALVRTRAFARPELASLVLFPLFVAAILGARRGGGRGAARRLLWVLPPLAALWGNLHGGFVLGLGAVGLAGLGSLAAGDARLARRLLACLAACAAATLINPYGWRLYEAVLLHARTVQELGGVIEEWRPLRLGEYPLFWALLCAAFARLALDLQRGPRRDARFWAPWVLGLGLFSASQVRYPVYFALTAAPYALRGAASRKARRAALAAGLGLAAWLALPALKRDFRRPVPWERLPTAAAGFLERERPAGRLLNDCAFGGYLAWRRAGDVFCDSRYLFHDLMLEWARASAAPASWREFLDRHGIGHALMRRAPGAVTADASGPLDVPRSPWPLLYPRDDWALVHWDDAAVVFARRIPANAELIARRERRVDPDDADHLLDQARRSPALRRAALAELELHEKEAGPTATGRWLKERLEGI